jgi:hypothetical protein
MIMLMNKIGHWMEMKHQILKHLKMMYENLL